MANRVSRLIVVASSLVFLTISGFVGVLWYGHHSQRFIIHEALHESVHPGDSMQEVQAVLGSGQLLKQPNDMLQMAIQVTLANREYYPEGVDAQDQFILYKIGDNEELYLQFRNDQLINHNPEHYAEYKPLSITLLW